jgi:hypothetical protein
VAARATSLAYWLLTAGEYGELHSSWRRGSRSVARRFGPEHPQVASTMTVKANLMLATRRYEEAALAASAADLLLDAEGFVAVSTAMNTEGSALAKLGKFGNREALVASLPCRSRRLSRPRGHWAQAAGRAVFRAGKPTWPKVARSGVEAWLPPRSRSASSKNSAFLRRFRASGVKLLLGESSRKSFEKHCRRLKR